ncbi:hypothetical protein ABPG75_009327 [Micractinium tetrahymenae]
MSDSDSSLDSELLAVAGKKATGKKRGRKALSSEEEEVSSDEVSLEDESDWDDAPSKKRGSGQKAPARKRQARGGRGRAASEDEDDSDDGERLEIDEEELIRDEEDRKRLAAMTELQREFELATRAEQRQRDLERQRLLKKVGDVAEKAEKAAAKAAKRVSGRSKSGREEREEAAKKSAMEELKAARERKARGAEERARKRDDSEEPEGEEDEDERRAEERERRERRRRDESEEEGALESEDEISDEGRGGRLYDRHRMDEGGEDEEDEAPLDDVKRIQVRREKLEQWVNEPFFEETLPGCMVRVLMGEEPAPDGSIRPKYMLCQVVAVETRAPGYYKDSGKPWKSPYEFGPSKEKIHKWLLVERGASQRGMPLALVSNTGFSELEFESWQRALKEQHRPQVSRRQAQETYERLVKANTYRYTAEDVDRLLKEKKAKGAAPRNAALERARLEVQLQHARENNDTDVVAELESQIAALDAALEEAKGKRKGHNMAELNKRNADLNFKNALDNVSNRPGGATGTQDVKASTLDPFSRRATRPVVYWTTKRQQPGEEADAAGGGTADAPAAAEQQGADAEDGQQQKQRGKLDLDSIVDLSSLDLSILEQPARMPPLARKLLGPTWRPDPLPPGARILSLDEYSRSRGW